MGRISKELLLNDFPGSNSGETARHLKDVRCTTYIMILESLKTVTFILPLWWEILHLDKLTLFVCTFMTTGDAHFLFPLWYKTSVKKIGVIFSLLYISSDVGALLADKFRKHCHYVCVITIRLWHATLHFFQSSSKLLEKYRDDLWDSVLALSTIIKTDRKWILTAI